jgi:hypothetical protein
MSCLFIQLQAAMALGIVLLLVAIMLVTVVLPLLTTFFTVRNVNIRRSENRQLRFKDHALSLLKALLQAASIVVTVALLFYIFCYLYMGLTSS